MEKTIPKALIAVCTALILLLGPEFIGTSLVYSQTNIRFSTWHVPVSREVKTVWEPMLEQPQKKEQWPTWLRDVPGRSPGKGPGTL